MIKRSRIVVCAVFFCWLMFPAAAFGGYLYVYNHVNGGANQIYGYSVNESTGALTLLSGFPVASGGNGTSNLHVQQLTVDTVNRRLYALNAGSQTLSAFQINANGSLTAMPFSPIALGTGNWSTVRVHPSGSPVVVGAFSSGANLHSFIVTATTATAASGSPYSDGASIFTMAFSRDGNFIYNNNGLNNGSFSGFSVNRITGVLTALAGSPFSSGGTSGVGGFATDNAGRLFTIVGSPGLLRAFTAPNGIPAAVTGNPFTSGLNNASGMGDSNLHPNQNFYYIPDRNNNTVGAYQISGSGAGTTLTAVAGSPFAGGGTFVGATVFNSSGSFLFVNNNGTRNITTYSVNTGTGVLTADNTQPANTNGTTGGLSGGAYFTGFIVNNNGDGTDSNAGNGICETATGNGICTLRAAIAESNSLAGDDVITFAPGITSISSAAGQMSITSNINILGPGANALTVQNTQALSTTSRIFSINSSTVGISGMTISGGNVSGSGGGITLAGNLTLTDCAVSGNSATSFGGGIRANSGSLTIIGSTISNNSTSAGLNGAGGIDNSGTLNLINSTVSGNSSTVSPGTGGIWSNGVTNIVNSTITNNNGAAGSDPAGGLYRFGTNAFTVRNSIVAGNQNNSTVPDIVGTFVSAGNNIIGNRGTATGFTHNTNGDKVGAPGAGNQINPLLGTLTNNGGRTLTHIPLTGSPAIDAGNNCVFDNTCSPSVNIPLTSDQRGATRQFDGGAFAPEALNVDIGAVEFAALAPTAALVSIGGRISTANGTGIRSIIVTLTDGNGVSRSVRTSTFGYYNFEDVEAGATYTINVAAKKFSFANPTQVITVNDNITDLDFIAE